MPIPRDRGRAFPSDETQGGIPEAGGGEGRGDEEEGDARSRDGQIFVAAHSEIIEARCAAISRRSRIVQQILEIRRVSPGTGTGNERGSSP